MTRAQSGRKQRWPFKTGVIARLATELYYRATNTHEIDGIITMEYHCVLFTVLLQLIIQPGRMSFFYYLLVLPMIPQCFPSLEEIPESCSFKTYRLLHLL